MEELLLKEGVPNMDAYMKLFKSTGWDISTYYTPEEIERGLKNCWAVVCAYDGDELVGSGRIISDGVIHAFITEVFVLPDRQGQGVGNAVMTHLLKRLKAANIIKVQLFAAPGKAGFYHQLGFKDRGGDSPGMDWKPES